MLDDDEQFCRILAAAIKPHGWMAETTFRMDDAMRILSQRKFDAVIVDLTLPDSTREQTIDRLPEILMEAWPARVVVVTGLAPDNGLIPSGVRVLRKAEEGILSKVLAAIGEPTPR